MERCGISLFGYKFLFLFLVFFLLPATGLSDPNLIIETQYGKVEGIQDGASEQWRGIPYAKPPLAELRFKDPEPPTPWQEVLDNSNFGPRCLQGVPGEGWMDGEEDCLYLNVFRPAGYDYQNNPLLPVLVHIHGGGNSFGSAEEWATPWLNQGLILVTMNYRLGPFGFLTHPQITGQEHGGVGSGNWGLMDQRQALMWVQQNIQKFGGDPQRVTLSGFSAGAQDAQALMASPLAKGLFQGVATLTTSLNSVYPNFYHSLDRYHDIGEIVAERTGCDQDTDPVKCMREDRSGYEILEAFTRFGSSDISPVVDGRVLPKPVAQLLEETDPGAKVPLLLGSAREESAAFLLWDILDLYNGELSRADYTLWSNDTWGTKNGAKARKYYSLEEYGSYTWAYLYMTTDLAHTCPVRDVARANAEDQATYRYLFTQGFENDEFLSMFGAMHGVDNFFLWNFYEQNWYPYNAEEQLLSERMTRYWANFAKTRDPNDDGNPNTDEGDLPDWPLYLNQSEEMLVLDTAITTLSGGYKNEVCDDLGGIPIYPSCTGLCRYYLQSELHLPGWWVKKVDF